MTRRTPPAPERIAALTTDPELLRLLMRVRDLPTPTLEQLANSRCAWVIAEMTIGSDADEAAYSDALHRGDYVLLGKLEAEGHARGERAAQYMKEYGL
jgi:hypothetical protein